MGPGRLFFHGKTNWRINSFPDVFLVGCKKAIFKAFLGDGRQLLHLVLLAGLGLKPYASQS